MANFWSAPAFSAPMPLRRKKHHSSAQMVNDTWIEHLARDDGRVSAGAFAFCGRLVEGKAAQPSKPRRSADFRWQATESPA
jgi:hypothetical protein